MPFITLDISSLERKKIYSNSNSFNYPYRKSALFLDRDGVLIEDRHYLSKPSQVKLCVGALDLVRNAFTNKIPVIVVTNQSGISRGFFDWNAYEKVTNRMLDLLGSPNPITAIYANGHSNHSSENKLSWRKPNPTMITTASKDLGLDLSRSVLVGDRLSDMKAGALAGLFSLVHVMSGHGPLERDSILDIINSENRFTFGSCPKVSLLSSLQDFDFDDFFE